MIWLAAKWAGLGKWRLPLVIGVLAVLALALTYCQGRSAGKAGEQLKQAEAAARVDAAGDKADAKAAESRVDTAKDLAAQQQELKDATRNAQSHDDARRLRGCAILRQQGRQADAVAAGC